MIVVSDSMEPTIGLGDFIAVRAPSLSDQLRHSDRLPEVSEQHKNSSQNHLHHHLVKPRMSVSLVSIPDLLCSTLLLHQGRQQLRSRSLGGSVG